jgi:hypothetical protein
MNYTGLHMQMYTDQQKEDNNKTIYLTPVFEEVPPRLGSQNVVGEPPVFRGKPLVCRERNRKNEEVTTIERTEIMVNINVWGQE